MMSVTSATEVTYLKGVGPQRAAIFASRGIYTAADLLLYLPFRYEDRIHFNQISDVVPGGVYTIHGGVTDAGIARFTRGRGAVFHLVIRDSTGSLACKFFHGGYLQGRFRAGQPIVVHGKADLDPRRPGRIEMINPQCELLGANTTDSTEMGRIVPVYEAIGNISSRVLRRIIYGTLQNLAAAPPDALPAALKARYGFPSRAEALRFVHFPPSDVPLELLNQFQSAAHRRLIFEELFLYQLSLALRKKEVERHPGISFRVREPRVREALRRILPFKPTEAQKRVLGEIAADLERPTSMHRLLQGDVGSGKTIVALETAAIVIENGYQAALMAPTEILAVQHFLSARRIFAVSGYGVELLISSLKGQEKQAVLDRMRSGKAQLVVGTHALLEEPAGFARLGLVIVDEQHRFGVLQRKRLIEKGAAPDVLVMTATPIPRTLALTLYGDLEVSVIDQMPPGRMPIETRWSAPEHLPGVWEFVARELKKGRQAYVVYPVLEQSKSTEAQLSLKSAMVEFERLRTSIFPRMHVGLLHGRMKSEEKDQVMERFRRGALEILVSTTVIEVGVDVPNATLMVIEHAERFGLSQLHQLRGRIGRGKEKSTCLLIAPKRVSEVARERLETMVATNDGFAIAETDLRLRGPGEFFGTRQHGSLGFHIANPLRDGELLELARREAFSLLENPEEDAERIRLFQRLDPNWQRRYQLAAVG
jgi:ATP-dependent DNA helicase RecG